MFIRRVGRVAAASIWERGEKRGKLRRDYLYPKQPGTQRKHRYKMVFLRGCERGIVHPVFVHYTGGNVHADAFSFEVGQAEALTPAASANPRENCGPKI